MSPGGHMIPSESSGDHAPRIKGMQTWPSEPFSVYPGDPVSLIPQHQLCSMLFSGLLWLWVPTIRQEYWCWTRFVLPGVPEVPGVSGVPGVWPLSLEYTNSLFESQDPGRLGNSQGGPQSPSLLLPLLPTLDE